MPQEKINTPECHGYCVQWMLNKLQIHKVNGKWNKKKCSAYRFGEATETGSMNSFTLGPVS